MDWTGYPKSLDADALVGDLTSLAQFLADPADQAYTLQVLDLVAAAQARGLDATAQVATAYPREVQAYSTWAAYTPTPTAAELLDALTAIPDAPVDAPAELTPVELQRLQVSASGATAALNMTYRLGPAHSWRSMSVRVPAPAAELDPRLLTDTAGAQLLVRVTVADDGEVPA